MNGYYHLAQIIFLCLLKSNRQLNNWLHKYVYKRKYENTIGYLLRKEYENGKIKTESEFKELPV